jgi:DNA-binding beta-propeller fold protein YncE
MKNKLIISLFSAVIIAALLAFASVNDVCAESYGVYFIEDGNLVKLASDGTEIKKVPLNIPNLYGLAINQEDGTIWVWNYRSGPSTITHLSANGEQVLASWTISWGWVKRLVVDSVDGGVWPLHDYNPYLEKYSADGTLMYRLTSPYYHWCGDVSPYPEEGTAWITDSGANRVLKVSSQGSEILSLSGFLTPIDVSVNPRDGSAWIADLGHNEVVKVDINGNELVRVNVGSSPYDIVANPADGGVWVSFYPEGPLKRLDSNGYVIAIAQGLFSGHYEDAPVIAPDGTVWKADNRSQKIIYKISATGQILLVIGENSDLYYDPRFVTIYPTNIINVTIDIKPGSDPNSINLSSAGVIPIAILSSDTFDATTVDPETVSLAGARVKMVGKSGKYLCHDEDVNEDGLLDLICQVQTIENFIVTGESVAVLEAETFDGTPIRGDDTVRIVPDN